MKLFVRSYEEGEVMVRWKTNKDEQGEEGGAV